MRKRLLLVLLMGIAISLNIRHVQADNDDKALKKPAFTQDELTIRAGGKVYPFHVEIAQTPPQLEYGLMFRHELAADRGMLFIFAQEGIKHMWMKNTEIPLDMLFIDHDGGIIYVAEHTVPESLTPIGPDQPLRAVLELSAGTVQHLGIHTGDKVVHKAFGAVQ